jgi:probable phosphoglycerate mutase
MTNFYIIRHGETEWNIKKIIQGHKDSPLTKKGIYQATQVAKELKSIKFAAMFSSDLLRAKRTAEIIAAEHDLVVITNEALRERAFGPLDGIPTHIFQKKIKHTLDIFNTLTDDNKKTYKLHPQVESDDEIVSRLLQLLREIAIGYENKNILIATHGGIMKALLIHLGFSTYNNTIKIKNASCIQLASVGIEFFIKGTNGITKYD